LAALNGHKVVVKLLVEKGVDVMAKSSNGWTALQVAAQNGHEAVVRLLLERGAAVNCRDREYGNLLQAAVYNGNYTLAQLLIKMGISADVQRDEFGDALQLGCIKGHMAIVEQLLCSGANPNKVDEHGWTPVFCALRHQQSAALDRLLLAGGDRDLPQVTTLPPTSWSETDKSACLQLGDNGMSVRYIGKLIFALNSLEF
jgi:ankyrin repeat protein